MTLYSSFVYDGEPMDTYSRGLRQFYHYFRNRHHVKHGSFYRTRAHETADTLRRMKTRTAE